MVHAFVLSQLSLFMRIEIPDAFLNSVKVLNDELGKNMAEMRTLKIALSGVGVHFTGPPRVSPPPLPSCFWGNSVNDLIAFFFFLN